MAKPKNKRYKLLFFKHAMDRIWKTMLILTVVLALFWFFGPVLGVVAPGSPQDIWLMIAAGVSAGVLVYAFLVRNLAFVQVKEDHVRIFMPWMPLKISYRRMRSVRPTDIRVVYEGRKLSWADKQFLRPYYGLTAIAMAVKDWPLPMIVMRMFMPKYYFLQKERGFLLLIEGWMDFSTEFDSSLSAYKTQFRPEKRKESMRGLYGGS
jgi:hypothetical protein